jgi:hypothetical protein
MSDNNFSSIDRHHYAQSEGDRDEDRWGESNNNAGGGGGLKTLTDDGSVSVNSDSTLRATAPVHVPLLLRQQSTASNASLCQSRLTKDILRFVDHIDDQIAQLTHKRLVACTRIRRVVSALWPRAQVKLYGSHVTNLALPHSDLDFVIVLPAVHKGAMVETPGILEGRNAIRETWQASLARKLRSEAWVASPNNIKIIERTVIPVIKITTTDGIELDISFDGVEHHGLENIGFVQRTLAEFQQARPLILVLKQFLANSGLLTAYTGGLSSYGLFLMVTRYLQEQVFSGGMDLGSLLMGFLDFYGNYFSPRVTGLSVLRRCYFDRHEVQWYHSSFQQVQQQQVQQQQVQQHLADQQLGLPRTQVFASTRSVTSGVSPIRGSAQKQLQQQQNNKRTGFERRHSFTDDDKVGFVGNASEVVGKGGVGVGVGGGGGGGVVVVVPSAKVAIDSPGLPPIPLTPPSTSALRMERGREDGFGNVRRDMRRSGSTGGGGIGGGMDVGASGGGVGSGGNARHSKSTTFEKIPQQVWQQATLMKQQRRQVLNEQLSAQQQMQQQQAQQFLLDPIFCEDPLSPFNNVLRNTFRILQVLRAFSDAHRSLQASLEFTEEGGGGEGREGVAEVGDSGYVLLDCILKAEDGFFS